MKLTVSLENESEEVKKVLYKEKRILDGILTFENIEKLINNKYKFNLTEMERYYIISYNPMVVYVIFYYFRLYFLLFYEN